MNGSFFNAPLSTDAYQDLLNSLIEHNHVYPVDSDMLRQSNQKDRKPMEKIDVIPAKDHIH